MNKTADPGESDFSPVSATFTICGNAQSPKHRKPSVTPDDRLHRPNSQPHINTSIEAWARIGGIIHQALRFALQETPPHKRAEAIEALAERGVWLTTENAHATMAEATA